jgi:hypothetical protein
VVSVSRPLPGCDARDEGAGEEGDEQEDDQAHPAADPLAPLLHHLRLAEDPGEVDVLGVGQREDDEQDGDHDQGDPPDLLGDGRPASCIGLVGSLVGASVRSPLVVTHGSLLVDRRARVASPGGATLQPAAPPAGATLPFVHGAGAAAPDDHTGDARRPHEEIAVPQGTIRTFDIGQRTATLLTDALVEHEVDREAVAASGLMELRIGQRVRFELDGERVTRLNIVSL